jgi:PAS domain S-box-containing protein
MRRGEILKSLLGMDSVQSSVLIGSISAALFTLFQIAKDAFNLKVTRWESLMVTVVFAILLLLWSYDFFTKLKSKGRELAESQKRFREFANLLPESFFEMDTRGNITFTNQAASDITGYTNQDVTKGVNALRLIVREQHPTVIQNIRSQLNGINLPPHEYTAVKKDGSKFPIMLISRPIVRENKIVGIRGFAVDITQQKQAQDELRAAKQQLEYVIAMNPAVVFAGKPLPDSSDWRLTYISNRTTTMLGYEPEAFLADSEFWNNHVHPDDLPLAIAETSGLFNEGSYSSEYRFLHRDGTYRWVHEEAKLLRAPTGEPLEVHGYWVDITKHREIEQRLAESERLAAIGQTAAMVGHDLRNPMQGIALALNLLKQDGLTREERIEMLDLIRKNLDYSNGIIKDLSEYSARIQLSLAHTTPKSLIQGSLRSVRVPANVSVRDLSEDRPSIRVDSERMKRVFINILQNAVEAMPEGGTLTIRSRQVENDLEVEFTDTGSGVAKEIMATLWSPLRTTKAKGMGLGLAICKRIVDAHRGKITVNAGFSGGTSVTLRIPTGYSVVEVRQQ